MRVFPFVGLVACLALASCGPAGSSTNPGVSNPDGGGAGGVGGDGGGGVGAGAGTGGATGGSGPTIAGSIGIAVIDVQETFVAGANTPDLAGVLERTKSVFQLGSDHSVPFFITFEASQTGDHALHGPLDPLVPAQAQKFTKTTFAATGLLSFASAVTQSKLTHLVVIGAETDVCVMQTVLGLRQLGFTVLLQKDAVMSSETNTSPALRRMQQAGAVLVDHMAVAGFVADPSELPLAENPPVRLVKPLNIGVVLNGFTEASVGASTDPLLSQKSARLVELLLVSEWFELPVYVQDPGAGLPPAFASSFQGQLRPLSQIAQDASVEQLVLAGTDSALPGAIAPFVQSHQLFVMEDALLALGTAAAQKDMLQPLYDGGSVPTTYKSFYYEMTRSVALPEWPSQAWVDKYDEYYWITQAPEDLPPIAGE